VIVAARTMPGVEAVRLPAADLLASVAVVAGTAVLGLIGNTSVPAADGAVGVILAAATLATLLASRRTRAADRAGDVAAIALIVFGWATALAIVAGRASLRFDALAASRYASLVAPIPAGLYLYWLGRRPGVPAWPAAALALGIVAGELVTNFEESRMAAPRAAFMVEQAIAVRCGTLRLDAYPAFNAGLPDTLMFLHQRRLSVFGGLAAPCPEARPPQ
jgi:hypothetical protein